jgi:hypothetical protein
MKTSTLTKLSRNVTTKLYAVAALVSTLSHAKDTAKLIEEAAASAHSTSSQQVFTVSAKHILRTGRSGWCEGVRNRKSNGPSGS